MSIIDLNYLFIVCTCPVLDCLLYYSAMCSHTHIAFGTEFPVIKVTITPMPDCELKLLDKKLCAPI
jgi:hypothetical protein